MKLAPTSLFSFSLNVMALPHAETFSGQPAGADPATGPRARDLFALITVTTLRLDSRIGEPSRVLDFFEPPFSHRHLLNPSLALPTSQSTRGILRARLSSSLPSPLWRPRSSTLSFSLQVFSVAGLIDWAAHRLRTPDHPSVPSHLRMASTSIGAFLDRPLACANPLASRPAPSNLRPEIIVTLSGLVANTAHS